MQRRPRRVTEYRLTLWIGQTDTEEQAYRTEHRLGPTDPLRAHLAEHVADLLAGEGEITGWWHITRIR